jgi:hypothetical protein
MMFSSMVLLLTVGLLERLQIHLIRILALNIHHQYLN